MSFRESAQIDKVTSILRDINGSIDEIDEFGYCSGSLKEEKEIKERSEILVKKLEECRDELSKFSDEISVWFSY